VDFPVCPGAPVPQSLGGGGGEQDTGAGRHRARDAGVEGVGGEGGTVGVCGGFICFAGGGGGWVGGGCGSGHGPEGTDFATGVRDKRVRADTDEVPRPGEVWA
jgi:hypothetical protein